MGLDMYLTRTAYIRAVDRAPESERYTLTLTRGGVALPVTAAQVTRLAMEVAFWHRAYAIHAWFVRLHGERVNTGECVDVTREELTRLRDDCRAVLVAPTHEARMGLVVERFSRAHLTDSAAAALIACLAQTDAMLTVTLETPDIGRYADEFHYQASV